MGEVKKAIQGGIKVMCRIHKIQIIGAMVIVLLLSGIFTTYNKNTNSVKSISTKIQDNILIKDNNLNILYNGDSKGIPADLQNKKVAKIASCEDTNNTICLFIK